MIPKQRSSQHEERMNGDECECKSEHEQRTNGVALPDSTIGSIPVPAGLANGNSHTSLLGSQQHGVLTGKGVGLVLTVYIQIDGQANKV